MQLRHSIFGFLAFALVTCSGAVWALDDQIVLGLQERIFPADASTGVVCKVETLCGSEVLPRFYDLRNFTAAWLTAHQGVRPDAIHLLQAIRDARQEGLRPQDYHLTAIETLLAETALHQNNGISTPVQKLVDLELLLTDAFLLYASHLSEGRVNPETIRSEWFIKTQKADVVRILHGALETTGNVKEALETVRPIHPTYEELSKALNAHREMMGRGGWPNVPNGPLLQLGDRGPRIEALRSRLMASHDLEAPSQGDPEAFDHALSQAVVTFQMRHGLKGDGIVGKATLAALNVPLEDRIWQIMANLERWRWLPRAFWRRCIRVNIANYALEIIDDDRVVTRMRVVVGRKYRRTPVLTAKLTHMHLNPQWIIPPRIARKDILPKIKKNPYYLEMQKIRIFDSWESEANEVDPNTVDWLLMTPGDFRFKLVQDPGPLNALGRIKFMFPNKFSVYLHDTPHRDQFERIKRNYSSGCIRVEKPIQLASYLVSEHEFWTQDQIQKALETQETQIVFLPESIPIQILYWTSWVDGEGRMQFREDIYGRDKRLAEALREEPPPFKGLPPQSRLQSTPLGASTNDE
jgi:murein L,D-transpeptidase YcbB/YkuD